MTFVTDRKQPSHYCLSQIDELRASTNKRSAMNQVLTRKSTFFGLAALAIGAGLVVAPALQEANAAETIVADASRVGEGQRRTMPQARRRVSSAIICRVHRHAKPRHNGKRVWLDHRHCIDTQRVSSSIICRVHRHYRKVLDRKTRTVKWVWFDHRHCIDTRATP